MNRRQFLAMPPVVAMAGDDPFPWQVRFVERWFAGDSETVQARLYRHPGDGHVAGVIFWKLRLRPVGKSRTVKYTVPVASVHETMTRAEVLHECGRVG